MGKWSKIADAYPKLPLDPERAEVLEARIADLRTQPLDDLFTAYNDERRAKDEVAQALKEINLKIEALEVTILRKMEAESRDSITTQGYKWTPSPEPYPKTVDPTALRTWIEANKPDALIIHAGKLKTATKLAIESNTPVPDGVEVFMDWSISRSKA